MANELAAAYAQVYELTHAACLSCPNEAAKQQYRCCDLKACENARKWAALKGVTLQATGHPRLAFMGPAGCVVPIELRPLCTMHHCTNLGGDPRYLELRQQIPKTRRRELEGIFAMSINALKLGFPGTVTSGNIIVLVVFADQEITVPAGWSEIQHSAPGGVAGVFYSASVHTATAAEVTAGTQWTWGLAGFTDKVGYDLFDFQNVTAFDVSLAAPFVALTTNLIAPSISVSNNELCFAFWVALNETAIRPPVLSSTVAGATARGGLSHAVTVFNALATGPTGALTATVDVPSVGVAILAAITGAGAHLASLTSGSLG